MVASRRRTLVILCLASAGWGFSFGLGVPLGSLWIRDAGHSARVVGLETSVYYLGVAVASLLLPFVLRRPGRRAVILGMLLDAATTALFPWFGGLVVWGLLRVLSGVATALSLIPMETRVNRDAAPERRARDFGLYAVGVALGVGCGPLVGLPLYPLAPRLAFALGGLVALLAAVLVAVALPPDTSPEEKEESGTAFRWQAAVVLALGTAWAQGFLEGGVLTFLSPYLLALGFGESATAGLTGVLFLGVILAQLPAATLADRLGRVRILLACHVVVLAGLVALPLCRGPLGLGGSLFLVGACCATLYPLGLALLGDRVPASALARANAWYLACNCLGSLTGPYLMGEAIDRCGWSGMFSIAAAAVAFVLAVWSVCGAIGRGQARAAAQDSSDARSAAWIEARASGAASARR
jgi:MFS family permease